MTKQEKQQLSEIDICDLFITPAIKAAGWNQQTQIHREFPISPGPIVVRGNLSSRNKKKSKRADYALLREAGVPIAVVEAKDNTHTVSHGLQQALGYAGILSVPSAFSSNGDAFASHNKVSAAGEDIECEFPLYEQILKDLQSAGNAGEFYTPRAVTQFIVNRVDPQLDELVLDPACGTGGLGKQQFWRKLLSLIRRFVAAHLSRVF